MAAIAVTGANGKTGRATVAELLAHGYQVIALDRAGRAGAQGDLADLGASLLRADLTDHGQTLEALRGADAVVHLANIPAPELFTPAHTFTANTAMNSNVFLAAEQLGLRRVVWASSETTLGLPFDTPPRYAPVDEAHFPFPTSTYALSKVVGETLAEQISGWAGIPFAGLRLSNVHTPEEYARFPGYWADPRARKWNLWGYVDVRDAAAAFRLALEAPLTGSTNFIIAAADTVMDTPSADLLAEVYPDVPVTREVSGHETLLSIDRAREVLGYQPRHSWRDHLPAPTGGAASTATPVSA
jgi:nucleoside-diphosphate-sugar epimerase